MPGHLAHQNLSSDFIIQPTDPNVSSHWLMRLAHHLLIAAFIPSLFYNTQENKSPGYFRVNECHFALRTRTAFIKIGGGTYIRTINECPLAGKWKIGNTNTNVLISNHWGQSPHSLGSFSSTRAVQGALLIPGIHHGKEATARLAETLVVRTLTEHGIPVPHLTTLIWIFLKKMSYKDRKEELQNPLISIAYHQGAEN